MTRGGRSATATNHPNKGRRNAGGERKSPCASRGKSQGHFAKTHHSPRRDLWSFGIDRKDRAQGEGYDYRREDPDEICLQGASSKFCIA